MLLRWKEQNEYGEVITRDSFDINVQNVGMYARRNCKKCYQRGWIKVDSGANPVNRLYRENNIDHQEDNLNERIVSCGCVDNHLARLDRLKELR